MTDLDYLAHLHRDTKRFGAVLENVDPAAPVPTCPEWNAADLLWHLVAVQWFWSRVVGHGLTTADEVQALQPPTRPSDWTELHQLQRLCAHELLNALAQTPPDAVRWTWAAEQTAGFSRRRQAQEALLHRVDAELVAGHRTAMDPELAADGVDEVFTVMYAAEDPLSEGPAVGFRTTDTGRRWLLRVGDPQSGLQMMPDPSSDRPADAEITAAAADLDCWLWHRPTIGQLTRTGSPAALDAFDAVVARGLQ